MNGHDFAQGIRDLFNFVWLAATVAALITFALGIVVGVLVSQ